MPPDFHGVQFKRSESELSATVAGEFLVIDRI